MANGDDIRGKLDKIIRGKLDKIRASDVNRPIIECQDQRREQRARDYWTNFHRRRTIDEIDGMTGREFERFIEVLMRQIGYKDVKLTPPAGDGGADVLCVDDEGFGIAVQAKRWNQKVGVAALGDVFRAMDYFKCDRGFVITTSFYTNDAKKHEDASDRIRLYDRLWLKTALEKFFPEEIPKFSWDGFQAILSLSGS